MKYLAALVFIACAVAFNVATARLGFVPVGFGLVVSAGTFTAGLALLVRDWVHETAGLWWVAGCIAAGTGLSAVTSSPALALASGAAFAASELADLLIYAPLRRKHQAWAMGLSNTVGALVDSIMFLSLAGFGLAFGVVTGQVLTKIAVTLPFIAVIAIRAKRRAAVGATA